MPHFVDVLVDAHADLPAGCAIRYKAESAIRPVTRVLYEPDDGPDGLWLVEACSAEGERSPARGVEVEDSGAGTSMLVYGGAHGLRLRHASTGTRVAETHLLLAPDDVLG